MAWLGVAWLGLAAVGRGVAFALAGLALVVALAALLGVGLTWLGSPWPAWRLLAWPGWARRGFCSGGAGLGLALALAWLGFARLGSAWLGCFEFAGSSLWAAFGLRRADEG